MRELDEFFDEYLVETYLQKTSHSLWRGYVGIRKRNNREHVYGFIYEYRECPSLLSFASDCYKVVEKWWEARK